MCVYRVSEIDKIGYVTTLVSTISDHVSRMLSPTQLVQNSLPQTRLFHCIVVCCCCKQRGVQEPCVPLHIPASSAQVIIHSHNALISWYNC